MNNKALNTIVDGVDHTMSDAVRDSLKDSIQRVSSKMETAKMNRTSDDIFGSKSSTHKIGPDGKVAGMDAEVYTNISEMINGSTKDIGGFGSLLDSLYAKNKKGYAILKDYELMPILIPQINRVLMFLVNECLSPDIQHEQTFVIKYVGDSTSTDSRVQDEIDEIKKEMKLDNLLRDIYMNRYKLGREYYLVIDYNRTFDHMLEMMKMKQMNESTSALTDMDFLDQAYGKLTESIDDASCSVNLNCLRDPSKAEGYSGTKEERETREIEEVAVDLTFKGLNIQIERSAAAKYVKEAQAELLSEAYSNYSMDKIMTQMAAVGSINEAVVDTSKLEQLVQNMKKKKLQRCMIERLDPAKVFKLKIGGKVIGYFHITDINEGSSSGAMVNFAQSLKDQLLKSRASNLQNATQTAEEVISRTLGEKIINAFDPNIGINRIEDIDLLHDFIRQNEVYKGNKRITFYYSDEIFDLSRADDSILINGVFFTKLYSTLLLNNIVTKVLRGRGRQIHTVKTGVSPQLQRYIQNAMASLTMPENNLGTLHGSFEQILNPFNAASDIVIPSEDDTDRFITTDYIPGQDVDMNDEFLKFMLNSIVSSFGLDSAVIDATNGNLQFARTLSMESLQIANNIRNEQQDLHDPFQAMCFEIMSIMGSDDLKKAVQNDEVKVEFFEPKSMIIQNTIDDLNSAKSQAEAIADVIPMFDGENAEALRRKFIYLMVKENTNIDWGTVEKVLEDVQIYSLDDQLKDEIKGIIQQYRENTSVEVFADRNGNGLRDEPNDEDSEDSDELTQDEQDLMGMEDDTDIND